MSKCWYSFGRENPLQRYEELSGKVESYAAGLPLTVKVLGSFLCGKDLDDWEDAIERLKAIPLKETLEKLELSYICLTCKGTEATRYLKLNMSRGNERILMKGLGKMKKLRYLEVKFVYYDSWPNW
ncbi:Toll/interleukin-1 receptor domain-containing protein, partial [Tanacetum coccineum]